MPVCGLSDETFTLEFPAALHSFRTLDQSRDKSFCTATTFLLFVFPGLQFRARPNMRQLRPGFFDWRCDRHSQLGESVLPNSPTVGSPDNTSKAYRYDPFGSFEFH